MTHRQRSSNSKHSLSFIPRRVFSLVSLLLLAIFTKGAFAIPIASPKISCVTPLGAGTKTGAIWANASSNLQATIDGGTSGEEVWVAGGTYNVPSDSYSFMLKDGVKIYGGFAATEGALANRNRVLTANKSILSASGIKLWVVNNSSVLTTATRLDGFTISGSFTCIFNYNLSSLMLGSLKITGNTGGGVLNMESSPLLSNCAISPR